MPRRQERSVATPRSVGVRLVVSLYREFEQVARRSDISMAQYRTLLFLSDGPRRAGELAAATAVTKPTVSAMIGSLRGRGWVEDVVDPADGRATRVVLTSSGIERVRAFEADLADRLEALMPGADLDQLRTTFADLYHLHGATVEERLANALGRPPS